MSPATEFIGTTTHSSLWPRAIAGDQQALAELSSRFWYPAYVWLRTSGNSAADVALHLLNFFARLQSEDPPRTDESGIDRLREFMLNRLKDFTFAGSPASTAMPSFAMDLGWAENSFSQEPTKAEDDLYGRRWALSMLEQTIDTLRIQYTEYGKEHLFAAMKPFLGFKQGDNIYADAASAIGMSASAFHVAVFEFRKRYRDVLRALVADTVRNPDDLDSELTALLVAAN